MLKKMVLSKHDQDYIWDAINEALAVSRVHKDPVVRNWSVELEQVKKRFEDQMS